MLTRQRVIMVLLSCLSAAGCADKTAIQLTMSSGTLVVGTDIDRVVVTVRSPAGRATADRNLTGEWPHTLTILPANGANDAVVDIEARAFLGETLVVQRLVRTRFSSGSEVTERVDFPIACVGVTCGSDQDCRAGTCCVPDGPDGEGDCPDLPDAGCTATGPEDVCNGGDDDCDGRTDEGLACPGAIVISEITTAGGSSTDELIELYNRTARPVDLSGVSINWAPGEGGFGRLADLPSGASIPAHGYYLLTSAGYTGGVSGDLSSAWTTDLPSAGGSLLVSSELASMHVDLVGWGDAMESEGTPIPALADDTMQSYERKASASSTAMTLAPGGMEATCGNGHDTDDNASDFVARSTPEPQTSLLSDVEAPCD